MKTIKTLSILVSLMTVVLVVVSYVNHRNQVKSLNRPYIAIYRELDKRLEVIKQQERMLANRPQPMIAHPESHQPMGDTAMIPYHNNLRLMVENSDKLVGEVKKTIAEQPAGNAPMEATGDYKFLFKLVFSAIFCIAALYVVLSNKYGEDTRKWAFSVLSLIAGIWIGSV